MYESNPNATVRAPNLVANCENTAYGVESIVSTHRFAIYLAPVCMRNFQIDWGRTV